MEAALAKAREAAALGEVPVGAVVVYNGEIIASAHNECEARRDPTAHAERLALARAAEALNVSRLNGCTLYVTLEPCPMCAGAIALMRPDAVVFAAPDPRAGCCGSVYRLTEDPALNLCKVPAHGGLLAEESARLLSEFFAGRRSIQPQI